MESWKAPEKLKASGHCLSRLDTAEKPSTRDGNEKQAHLCCRTRETPDLGTWGGSNDWLTVFRGTIALPGPLCNISGWTTLLSLLWVFMGLQSWPGHTCMVWTYTEISNALPHSWQFGANFVCHEVLCFWNCSQKGRKVWHKRSLLCLTWDQDTGTAGMVGESDSYFIYLF